MMLRTGQNFRTLHIEGMARTFGDFKALNGITLDIQRGEFVALLGPSGCGKSTALNCIAGLLPMTGGTIRLDDQRIDLLKTEDRGFGMVFQNYALFPHMTVRDNIGFGLRMRGVPGAELSRRVEAAVALVRMQEQAHKLPGQLSGGQQQRVAIARAIAIEPSLVLMDEPLSNLDAKLRLEMRQEIRRIHMQQHATTVYVTHDQEEALSLADRIVVMRDGQVQQVGSPSDLYDLPVDLAVADFMGFRNRLIGSVQMQQGQRVSVAVSGAAGTAETLTGRARHGSLGDRVVLAVRPDDLTVQPQGLPGISAVVEMTEYRGRGFQATGKTADGQAVYFSVDHAVRIGETVILASNPDRALVYPA